MKLRTLELEQFRKFGRRTTLSGFNDSVNVLCGPNEFGKSTVLVAIRGLLFERHSSRADAIKRMQSWGGNAAPSLAMEFETGGGLWRIEKRFLHQPMARLTAPDGSRFDNDAAEEELQRLLGFGAAGKQGARTEQMGVWGALWVTQRESVQQADLTSDLARSTITSCLDAEVGVLTGTEKGQAVMRAVRDRRGKLLDGRGNPKDRYRQVIDTIAAADASLADMRERATRLGEDADELRRCAAAQKAASDPAAEAQDRTRLDDARTRREAAQLYDARLQAATASLVLAERQWEDADRERRYRAMRGNATEAAERDYKAASGKAETARTADRDADRDFATQGVQLEMAQTRATLAAVAARRARYLVDIARQSGVLSVLDKTIAKAEAAQSEVTRLSARLAGMRADLDAIKSLRKLLRDRDNAAASLLAQATRIEFELRADAAGRVLVGSAPVSLPIEAVDDVEIDIEGLGRIRVRPAIQDRNMLVKRLDVAEDRVSRALLDLDCADAEAAEQRHAEREDAARGLADARADLERLAPGNAQEGLAPGLGPLREHADILRRRLDEAPDETAPAPQPALPQAHAGAKAADEEERAAAEALTEIRGRRDLAASRRAEAREALVRAEATARRAEDDRTRLADETAAAEAAETSGRLAERLERADAGRAKLGAELASLERGRPQDTVDGMQARIARYEQALAARQTTIRKLGETIAALRARIVHEGGQGLDEQIAGMARERDTLILERDGYERDTRVLDLLIATLTTAERETKQRYLEPVIRRVTPYLRSLFPGAEIDCDDALRITGLTREVLGKQDFDRLSDGTQEQIAVLSRLAFAEMLTDQGKPAMVILDDALAYSDAERLERMFDVLTLAAAKTQILVLTCREDLFARLGGNRIVVTQDNGAGLS